MSSVKRSRILFISHTSEWAGAEHCLYSLVSELDRSRYEPIVLLPGPGPLKEKISALKIETRIANLHWCVTSKPDNHEHKIQFLGGLRKRTSAIADIIRSDAIDVVFTNSLTMMDGAVAAYLCGVPHVWQVLEMLGKNPDLHVPVDLTAFYRMVDLLSDRIITVSRSVQENIENYTDSNKIRTVYSGIDLPETFQQQKLKDRLGVDQDDQLICFVGRLTACKGVASLVDVARLVVPKLPKAKFIIVGPDGGAGKAMQAAVSEDGLSPYFRFLGFRDDSLDIIANSDLFVLPSVADSLPIVVLESMLLGKPVVATRSGGASEMVVDDETGCLVPVGEPEPMASAIIRTLETPERAREMGRRGQQRAKELFNRERYAREIEKIFAEVTADKPENKMGAAVLDTILQLFENAAADKSRLFERERTLRDYEALRLKIQRNPLFKTYHWLKYLGQS